MKPKISLETWTIALIFLSGLWLRLYHLGVPSLWFDELSTAVRINHPFLQTVALLRHSDFPPLHYAILNLWVSIVGNSEWALRFPSAIFSSLTIIIIYLLGKELFNKGVGLLAAAMLAFSPFALNYAQDAKMYPLFWLLTATGFLFLFRCIKDKTASSHRGYIITAILGCYTMYTGYLFLVVQSIIYLLSTNRSRWQSWFKGQGIILLSCLPWLIFFLGAKHVGFNLRPADLTIDYGAFFLEALLWIIGSSDDAFWRVNYFLYFILLGCLVWDWVRAFDQRQASDFPSESCYRVLMWVILSVLCYFIFDRFLVPAILEYRYMGFIQVPMILLVASQAYRCRGWVKALLIAVMMLVSVHNTYVYVKDDLRHPHQDWRQTAVELAQEKRADDIVLVFLGLQEFKYYYKGNTKGFLWLSKKSIKDCSSEYLEKRGVLNAHVHAIFVLNTDFIPQIVLHGFSMDQKIENGDISLLRYQRLPSSNEVRGQ